MYWASHLMVKRKSNFEFDSGENIWLEVIYPNYSFMLCTLYRPPNCNIQFWDHLEYSIENVINYNPNIVIVGDINVDMLTNRTRRINDLLNQYQFTNVIHGPTRIGDTRSSLLDPILVRECSVGFSSVIDIDRDISDHNATEVEIIVNSRNSTTFKREIWSYSKANFLSFNNEMLEKNWVEILGNDVETACDKFTEKYIEVARKHIPTKLITVRTNDKPWFNSEIRREIRKRERLRKRAKKLGSETALLNYKRQRNRVNNMKKHARESYFMEVCGLIDQYAFNNQKDFWKLVKTLTKSSGTVTTIPPLINPIDSNIEVEDKRKADVLNRYFADISTINDSNVEIPDFPSRTDQTITNFNISQDEVVDVLNSLKLNKATGLDAISHQMLKNTANSVSLPLSILFNMALEHSIFPSVWKKARVIPLYKKGDMHQPCNYRPISLLSKVSKVFERIIHKHLHNYMLDNHLLYPLQSGFLPNNSTVYQLLEIYHNICINRENKKNTCFVFCDVSKAFDKVWHAGLLTKLQAYGISGQIFSLLKNYLSDRKQLVFVNSSCSDYLETTAGVPQGSVLGPFLFLIFINDIVDNLVSVARLFADDTSMSASSSEKHEIENTLNDDLNTLKEWSHNWLVTFNPSKTEVLYFSANNANDHIELQFDGTVLNNVNDHKHLGITFMSNGKWTSHITNICNYVYKQLNVLRKLKYVLSRLTLSKIYNTFILPRLEYACEVWDGLSTYDCNKLEKVQLEAARIVTGLPLYASRESLYAETGWEPLFERRKRRKLNLFYKIHNNLVPGFLSDIVSPFRRNNDRNLRNSRDYVVPRFRLSSTLNSFFPSSIKLWDDLTYELRHNCTQNQFKYALKCMREVTKVPSHYNIGDRKGNVYITRLRNKCSILKNDLYRVNLVNDKMCTCGYHCEDTEHFLLNCPNYVVQRNTLFNSLHQYQPLTVNKLLFGDCTLSAGDNEKIFLSVQKFLISSHRF